MDRAEAKTWVLRGRSPRLRNQGGIHAIKINGKGLTPVIEIASGPLVSGVIGVGFGVFPIDEERVAGKYVPAHFSGVHGCGDFVHYFGRDHGIEGWLLGGLVGKTNVKKYRGLIIRSVALVLGGFCVQDVGLTTMSTGARLCFEHGARVQIALLG